MEFITYFFGFLIGSSITSFYVTLAERILRYFYEKERKGLSLKKKVSKILFHPSSCNTCQTRIPSIYLVPVLGYFFSFLKCVQCKQKIPILYPMSEFLGGMLFVYSFILYENWLLSSCLLAFFGHLSICMLTDFKKFSLDYENLPFIILFGMIVNYLLTEDMFKKESFFVFLGFLVFYFLLYLFYKNGIGLGDVIFAPVFAFLSGHPWWMLYLNSSYVLAVASTILFRNRQKKLKGIKIPMGAYLAIGIMITFLFKMYYNSDPNTIK